MAPKSHQKSMSTLKAKNQLNASRLAFSLLSGVQVGSKHGPKINQKMRPAWEGVLALIFLQILMDLGSQVGTESPIRSGQTYLITSDQLRSGQTGSGEVWSGQVRTSAIREICFWDLEG